MALFEQETLEEVLPVAGVLVWGPLLSCVTTGKAKKESTMQETQHNGGGGVGDSNSRDKEVAATRISCCLSNFFVWNLAQAITSPFMQESIN